VEQDYAFGHPGLLLSQHERARALLLRERPDIQERRLYVMGAAPRPNPASARVASPICSRQGA